MLGIILTFLAALLGLFLLLVFTRERTAQEQSTDREAHVPIAGLSAAFLPPFDIIVGSDDYRRLLNTPELNSVCAMFRRDRRRIVLMWLDDLRKDVHILSQFRRFLVRNGLRVTFQEEASVVFRGLLALLYLSVVRAAVFAFGPFALQRALGNVRLLVEQLSSWGVAALSRMPDTRKAEIVHRWTEQLMALGIKIS